MPSAYCTWEFGQSEFINYDEMMAIMGLVYATAAWVGLNLLAMVYIFFKFMVPLRIYGKMILTFYLLAML